MALDFLLLAENLSNEERTWEEIMQIKAMPVSMMQKKEMKAKLQVRYILNLSFIMSTNK